LSLRRIQGDIREVPLEAGEIRRITGMGLHFIARADTETDDTVLARLFTLWIDDVEYGIFYKLGGSDGNKGVSERIFP
jgi:hypothetical protein